MPTENEVLLHQVQTRAFIDANPVDLVLRRKVDTPDGVGGTLKSAPALDLYTQTVRVVGQRRPLTRITSDGRQVEVDKSVVGTVDFDVEIGDEFTHLGNDYEIINIQDQPVWRKTAEAVRRG